MEKGLTKCAFNDCACIVMLYTDCMKAYVEDRRDFLCLAHLYKSFQKRINKHQHTTWKRVFDMQWLLTGCSSFPLFLDPLSNLRHRAQQNEKTALTVLESWALVSVGLLALPQNPNDSLMIHQNAHRENTRTKISHCLCSDSKWPRHQDLKTAPLMCWGLLSIVFEPVKIREDVRMQWIKYK